MARGSNHGSRRLNSRLAAVLAAGAIALSFATSHAQPALEVRSGSDASVTLRRPAASPGFALESTPSLGSTAHWTAVSTPPTPSGIHFQLTVRPRDRARFFRLRQNQGPSATIGSQPGLHNLRSPSRFGQTRRQSPCAPTERSLLDSVSCRASVPCCPHALGILLPRRPQRGGWRRAVR